MKDRHFRCGSLRILLLLCLIVSTQTTIQADIVKGRVVDAETKEPLPEATVKLTQRYGDYGTMINTSKPSAALLTGQESPATRPASLLTGKEPCAERSADEQTGHYNIKIQKA